MQPAQIRWEFGPDIPTHDFLEGGCLDETWSLQEAVDGFVDWMEENYFLTWEAVVCDEQGLPHTSKQERVLRSLLSWSDSEGDKILYIDEISRPSDPWHVILNKIVPHLEIQPFRTFDCHESVRCDGWQQIIAAVKEHGQDLSLPRGVESVERVVPAKLQHTLWLQYCFNDLDGLGQEEDVTLEDPEEHYRIEWFIEHLRECKENVAYFDINLESLLRNLILPAKDQPIFLAMMEHGLGLSSVQEPLACRL